MAEYYNREQLKQFFTSPMDEATEAEQYAAGVRLIAEVFRTMKARYPDCSTVVESYEAEEYPMHALWTDPTWGTQARDLMVEMGLLLRLPPHIAEAFLDEPEEEA